MRPPRVLVQTAALMAAMAAVCTAGPVHPNTLLSQGEIYAIQARVAAGDAPWKQGYDAMIVLADSALGQTAESVVDNGAGCANSDPHRFSTDGVKEGVWGDRSDYQKAARMSRAIVSLGVGYAFTRESRYADKAIELLDHWMVSPETRMVPLNRNFSPATCGWGTQWTIEIMVTIPGMIYGADLIRDYPGWDPEVKDGVDDWVRAIGEDARRQDGGYYNNGENWRYLLVAIAGAFLHDDLMMAHAFGRYTNAFAGLLDAGHPDGQMNLDGSLRSEIVRTNSLDYSTYALLAMIATAEVARHRGIDLYNFELPDGRSLEHGLDYVASSVANPGDWPHPQSPDYRGGNAGLFELAYLWKPKPEYLAAVERWNRPVFESRILGFPSLTHGAGAYPWRIHVPSHWQNRASQGAWKSSGGLGTIFDGFYPWVYSAELGAWIYVHPNERKLDFDDRRGRWEINRWVRHDTGDAVLDGFYFYSYGDGNWYFGFEYGDGWAFRISGDEPGWTKLF